jgi:hypothetical protein
MTDNALQRTSPTGMELLAEISRRTDCTPEVAMAVAKAGVDLQIKMVEFDWKREERQAKIDFDEALNECQSKIGRIAPNQNRTDTHSWWADYAQLDRTVRPIYTAAGFSIAYSEVQSLAPGKVRTRAELSRGGVSKEYFSEITPSTVGPKGKEMATATDADAIALSRNKRYLLLSIFNIAVGIDKIEKEGIPSDGKAMQGLDLCLEDLKKANTVAEAKAIWHKGVAAAKEAKDATAIGNIHLAFGEASTRINGEESK